MQREFHHEQEKVKGYSPVGKGGVISYVFLQGYPDVQWPICEHIRYKKDKDLC